MHFQSAAIWQILLIVIAQGRRKAMPYGSEGRDGKSAGKRHAG